MGAIAAKGSIAAEAYAMLTEILHLDNNFDDLSTSKRKKQRQLVLKEKVDAYFAWVKLKCSQVTHELLVISNNLVLIPYCCSRDNFSKGFIVLLNSSGSL